MTWDTVDLVEALGWLCLAWFAWHLRYHSQWAIRLGLALFLLAVGVQGATLSMLGAEQDPELHWFMLRMVGLAGLLQPPLLLHFIQHLPRRDARSDKDTVGRTLRLGFVGSCFLLAGVVLLVVLAPNESILGPGASSVETWGPLAPVLVTLPVILGLCVALVLLSRVEAAVVDRPARVRLFAALWLLVAYQTALTLVAGGWDGHALVSQLGGSWVMAIVQTVGLWLAVALLGGSAAWMLRGANPRSPGQWGPVVLMVVGVLIALEAATLTSAALVTPVVVVACTLLLRSYTGLVETPEPFTTHPGPDSEAKEENKLVPPWMPALAVTLGVVLIGASKMVILSPGGRLLGETFLLDGPVLIALAFFLDGRDRVHFRRSSPAQRHNPEGTTGDEAP